MMNEQICQLKPVVIEVGAGKLNFSSIFGEKFKLFTCKIPNRWRVVVLTSKLSSMKMQHTSTVNLLVLPMVNQNKTASLIIVVAMLIFGQGMRLSRIKAVKSPNRSHIFMRQKSSEGYNSCSLVNSVFQDNIYQKLAHVGKVVVISSFLTMSQVTNCVAVPDCPSSVVHLENKEGREVTLIGTAHISEDSVALVRRTIRNVRPDTVMIELDQKRVGKLRDEKDLQNSGFELPKPSQSVIKPLLEATSGNQEANAILVSTAEYNPAQRENVFSQISTYFKDMFYGVVQKAAGVVLGKDQHHLLHARKLRTVT